MFYVIITNEVPPTILQAYMSLPRHIRKGVLIRRNIASHLFTAVGCQQFRKESRKNIKGELCLNVIISFSIIVCCLVVALCSKNSILNKLKWGAQADVWGGTASPGPPVATALNQGRTKRIQTETLDPDRKICSYCSSNLAVNDNKTELLYLDCLATVLVVTSKSEHCTKINGWKLQAKIVVGHIFSDLSLA